jgi:hypothetical protein
VKEHDKPVELDRDVDEGEGRVLSVHFGRAASCSSVGSVVDVLFLSTVAGAAVISALGVWLAREADPAETETDSATETETETETDSATETETDSAATSQPERSRE